MSVAGWFSDDRPAHVPWCMGCAGSGYKVEWVQATRTRTWTEQPVVCGRCGGEGLEPPPSPEQEATT